MCYEERVFRSWAMKMAQKREKVAPASEHNRSQGKPLRAAPAPETDRREEVEREPEEII